jgi:hypothetical protein
MQVALPALLTRPACPACAPADVPMRTDASTYGVHRLPVAVHHGEGRDQSSKR